MNKKAVISSALLVAPALVLGLFTTHASAQASNSAYLQDARGAAIRDTFNLCYRTGYWSPAMATAECDPDLVAKPPAPVPVPVPVPIPIPVPAPAPAPPPPPPAPAPAPREVAPTPAPIAPAPAPAPAARAAAPTSEKITMAADDLFDFGKAVIKPAAKAKMDDLVGKLKGVNLEVVIAIGHADSIGSDKYNMKLSLNRAESVKAYLVSKGVPANRIYTEGKGKRQPIASNKSKDGRAKNRRVEIEVVGNRLKN